MKLSELIVRLQYIKNAHPREDPEVLIPLSKPSTGGSAATEVRQGFDWDSGRVFIIPDHPLINKSPISYDEINLLARKQTQDMINSEGFSYLKKDVFFNAYKDGFRAGMYKLLEDIEKKNDS